MNIANIHDCYGCGVCAAACPRRIISMRLNGDGFYEPHIADESRCTGCALCLDVCSYSHDGLALEHLRRRGLRGGAHAHKPRLQGVRRAL